MSSDKKNSNICQESLQLNELQPSQKVIQLNNNEIELIAKLHNNLSVQEFINITNFDIETLRMDVFWHSIQDDKIWIYGNL
jgi:hypothetical protein